MYIFFIGADPTLKDSSGHTAVEYAGSAKIKEFLSNKMETVTNQLSVILVVVVKKYIYILSDPDCGYLM